MSDKRYEKEIFAFPDLASRVLPPAFDPTPSVFRAGDLILFYWHSRFDVHNVRATINPGIVTHPTKGTFFSSGYAAENMINGDRRIFSLVELRAKGIAFEDSPGGVGANVWIDKEGRTAQCWSTQPQAVPTFYAKSRNGFCVVGNRPKLVECASTLGAAHKVNPNYLQKYIVSGFAFDGSTPYEHTKAVNANSSLILDNGKFEAAPYPIRPLPATPHDRPLDEKSRELAGLLISASWPARAIGRSNLFLSGGKDSRALASALKGTSGVSAFTIGDVAKGEGFAAKPVAEALGSRFSIRPQPVISDPLKAAAISNLNTDGLGINFAHQYNFLHDLSFLEGLPSYHGHGHLLRGGFARSMNKDLEHLRASVRAPFISEFVVEGARIDVGEHLDKWIDERSADFRDSRDILFYSNLDHRLGLFTAPVSLEFASKTFMVWPLLDERVARYAASLAVFDRVSERVVFGAMRMLAREMTELPLFGEIWRFDRSPEKRDFVDSDHNFQEGFELRQPREASKLDEINIATSAFTFDADKAEFANSAAIAARFILDSSRALDVRRLLEPWCMAEIESLARHGSNTPAHARRDPNRRFVIGSFISRVFVATTLYDLRW
jgi:hypothetical protein